MPSNKLPAPAQGGFALKRTKVLEQRKQQVRLDERDSDGNDIWVSSQVLHGRDLGITILRIGDLLTEEHTLDPLTKSTLHYLRLLLEPDAVRMREIRTTIELEVVWRQLAESTSHLVLIGHGDVDNIKLLGAESTVTGHRLGELLSDGARRGQPKTVVSLSCLTGRAAFARDFSASDACAEYLAPFHSVHSAAASLYAQSFFANHLLNGMGVIGSHRRAREVVGSAGFSFRHWRNGRMVPKSGYI